MKEKYIENLMQKLQFPASAQKEIMDTVVCILNNKDATEKFTVLQKRYDESEICPYDEMLNAVKEIGNSLNIHEYTISLILFLSFAEKLFERYVERGISEEIYYNTLADLRYKLEECRLVYGITGSFVANWFGGFFALKRFALGRLQFEIIDLQEKYVIDNIVIHKGSKAINVHIPRTGTKLDHNEVLRSYDIAAKFFAKEFENQPIIFACHSWLLDPWNLTVLSDKSNLALFSKDYKIVQTGGYKDYSEIWRLFDCVITDDVSKLPQDTSLRKAYVERMLKGENLSWGQGVFVYKAKEK